MVSNTNINIYEFMGQIMSDSPRCKVLDLRKGKDKGSTFLFAPSPHLLGGAAVASTGIVLGDAR